jgi:hypothetical protein
MGKTQKTTNILLKTQKLAFFRAKCVNPNHIGLLTPQKGELTCLSKQSHFGLDAEAPALSDERLPSPPGDQHRG